MEINVAEFNQAVENCDGSGFRLKPSDFEKHYNNAKMFGPGFCCFVPADAFHTHKTTTRAL
jgi:hypothetical protein